MTSITFIDFVGNRQEVDAEDGFSIMETAVRNSVSGIVGECGGSCACGSCHVYVAEDWIAKLPAAEEMEREMLDLTFDTTPASRLGCQVTVTADLAGLVLTTPKPRA